MDNQDKDKKPADNNSESGEQGKTNETPKTLTQEQVDNIISNRISEERKKFEAEKQKAIDDAKAEEKRLAKMSADEKEKEDEPQKEINRSKSKKNQKKEGKKELSPNNVEDETEEVLKKHVLFHAPTGLYKYPFFFEQSFITSNIAKPLCFFSSSTILFVKVIMA